MAKRRRGRTKKHREPDPEDVLEGRIAIGLKDLFRLVHRVNPTGQGLSQRQQEHLYEQKSRLQSLLIRRFGDEIAVERGTGDGVVSLVHRQGLLDACHAVLTELDPDARSWAQHQLDVEAASGDESEPREPGRPEPGPQAPSAHLARDDSLSSSELIARGEQAIRDFDYESAERDLTRALERSKGGVEAALPLLELRVGVLGMDQAALSVEPRLSAAAKADPAVRAQLALAAARLGEEQRALDLGKGIDDARAAEVHAALAAHAIRQGDPEAAGRYLDAVTARVPTHPEIPSLERGIAELRAENRRPAEEKLFERYRVEGLAAVEEDARDLHRRWPESEVARRILREAAVERRDREIAESLERGERALAEERFSDAARDFQKALEAGSERADLVALVEEARGAAREREREEHFRAVLEHFGDDDRGALLAYLSCSEELRSRLRERLERPVLDWLEEIGAAPSGAKALAAVQAVLALEGARAALDRGEAREALDAVSSHMRMLRGLGEARRCLEQANSQLAAGRRARARELLEAACAAYEAARREDAKELLEAIDLGELTARERSQAEELGARIDRAETLEHREHEYERHLAAEDLLGALERAEQLAEDAGEEASRRRWAECCAELRRRIPAAWKVEVTSDVLPLAELRAYSPPFTIEIPQVWLDDDGREMVLVNAWSRWLFIRVVDVDAAAVVERVSLRTPEPLGRLMPVICRDGDRLRIIGQNGQFFELARRGWEILRWRSLRGFLPERAVIDQTLLPAGSPYLWFVFRIPPAQGWSSCVVDLRTWRISRRLSVTIVDPILGEGEPRVLSTQLAAGAGARVYSARGTPERELRLPPGLRIMSVAAGPAAPERGHSPDGSKLWVVALRRKPDEDGERLAFLDVEPTAEGSAEIRSQLPIAEAFDAAAHPIATMVDQGLGFVLVATRDYRPELMAVSSSTAPRQSVRQLYRVPVPNATVLIQDRRARRVFALALSERGVRIWPLGPEPPPPGYLGDASKTHRECLIPDVQPPYFCDSISGTPSVMVQAFLGELRRSGTEHVIRVFEARHAADIERMVLLCIALRRLDIHDPLWSAFAREHLEQAPQDPGAALVMAEIASGREEWDEVRNRLQAVDPAELDDGRCCHYYHLLGLAFLYLERSAEAVAAFEKGLEYDEGTCFLHPLLELVRPMSDPPEPEEWGPDQPLVRQIAGAIRTADRALAADDPEAARAALDRPPLWRALEVQSAARLAQAWLRIPVPAASPAAAAERFCKRLGLALFCHLYENGPPVYRGLYLPGLGLESSRLAEIARRAHAWLGDAPERSFPPGSHGPRAPDSGRPAPD